MYWRVRRSPAARLEEDTEARRLGAGTPSIASPDVPQDQAVLDPIDPDLRATGGSQMVVHAWRVRSSGTIRFAQASDLAMIPLGPWSRTRRSNRASRCKREVGTS